MSAGQLFLEPGGLPVTILVAVKGVQEAVSSFDRLRGSMNQLRGIITQASITTYVFSMLMRRQSQTARTLQTVQENTAQTIRKYGRFSLEATQALRRLEQAQENAKFSQIEFAMQTVLTAASIFTLIFRVGEYIASLKILEGQLITIATLKAIAFPALAVAGGIIGGIAIGSIVFGGGDASDAEFNRQWEEVGAVVKRKRNSMRR